VDGRILIGTSGWSYGHWRGAVYPPGLPSGEWLASYAARLPTVELNTTFYGTPAASAFKRWRDAVPPGFVFAVKANRFITHRKRLRDAAQTVPRELDAARALGDALGPVLFQVPPRMHLDLARLTAFVEALPPHGRFAFEFRDHSWDDRRVGGLLAAHGATVCRHDWGGKEWPSRGRPEPHGVGFVYVRLHGPRGTYDGRYGERRLAGWAERLAAWSAEGRDVFCYFNNDAGGSAVYDALALRRLLGQDVPDDEQLTFPLAA
jgi:uncharacterized protein YecE (DUF72 family)